MLLGTADTQNIVPARPGTRSCRYRLHELCCAAILSNPKQRMSLASIRNWIASHYVGYPATPEDSDKSSWKGSVSRELSNRADFVKFDRDHSEQATMKDFGKMWAMAENENARSLVMKMRGATHPVMGDDPTAALYRSPGVRIIVVTPPPTVNESQIETFQSEYLTQPGVWIVENTELYAKRWREDADFQSTYSTQIRLKA